MTDIIIKIDKSATISQVATTVETLLGAGGAPDADHVEDMLGLVNTPPVLDSQGNSWMRVRIPDEYLAPLQAVADQSTIASVIEITSGPYEVEPGIMVGQFA